MEKKILRVSMKTLFSGIAIIFALIIAVFAIMLVIGELDFDFFKTSEVIRTSMIFLIVISVYICVYIYQYYNNVLEYGNYGFATAGKTYSYSQATKLVAIHRGRHGTYYHLYVGDEIVFRFSRMYENKDDFIELLQKNGVLIVA